MSRLIALALALAFVGCTPADPAEPDPTPTPEPVEVLPDVIPLAWLENLSGTITHTQEYRNNGMEGTTCEETFEANGANISGFEPNECEQCEMVFSLFLNQTVDCLGNDVLEDAGELGLDLRQTDGESVFWWYDDGLLFGWGAGWDELGTGTVVQNPEDLTLDIVFVFEDPRNSDNGPSTGDTDDCGTGLFGDTDPCRWHGTYTIELQLELDEALIEWELEDVDE
jgi:hypothetical protein